MSNNLYRSEDSTLSLWDAANVLEYATSRFTSIQLSLQRSHVTRTDAYHSQFVRYLVWEAERFVFPFINICAASHILAGWQIGALDNNKLYDAFENFDCMDHFDLGLFEMPNHISLLEVKELVEEHVEQLNFSDHFVYAQPVGHLLIPKLPQMPTGRDPLLHQVHCIRKNMQRLGEGLHCMLLTKVEEGDLAVDALWKDRWMQ
ncbi:uncharacterized protein F5147DRAFT_803820 [Suillus discolor]|uniref:Uncharacterized protein n=1 Tax=Suillus discolor TaxID=1912936 RepID=A0A9P7ERF2_9AGAM|nr:uncharacterized protein F5147DRAFT_803820 [Suillus discolor]KAG2082553.1 hypothetical protein F5147DRAFT_803820 [Suillus discolor]